MEVLTLYVGQGSLSVITGDSEAIIVDSNIPPHSDERAEFMKAVLAQVLSGKEVVGLVLTGLDADHADPPGVAWVLRKYQPNWIMYPQYMKLTGTAGRVFRIIKEASTARATTARPLVRHPIRIDRMADRTLRNLSREWDIVAFSPHPVNMLASNNCSLVAKVVPKNRFFGFRYLITGDTENDRWDGINQTYGEQLRAEVMAAPHHGSRNGINARTLELVAPDIVVVNAGVTNRFGHPHDEALALFAGVGASVYSTHTGKSFRTSGHWWWGGTKAWSVTALGGS